MESKCHKEAKIVLCRGADGTESRLPSGRRIDCRERTSWRCYEVELHRAHIGAAITRLNEGLKAGKCSSASLVTQDRHLAEARKLAGTRLIKVVGLSTIGVPKKSG